MARHLPSILSLRAFEAAARHESFSAAAVELALSQSTVSYRVRQLEELLSTALFHRLTRRIELTAAGARFLPVARDTLERLTTEIDRLRAEHRPNLRIHLSTYFAARWLSPRLAAWQANPQAPEIVLDHGSDDGGRAEPDLVIRWGRGDWPGWRARLLIPTRMTPHCSPALARSLARPQDVLSQTLLAEPEAHDMWPVWLAAAGLSLPPAPTTPGQRRIVLADSNVRLQAAVDGLGVVLADHLAEAETASGRLLIPFALTVGGSGFHLLTKGKPPPPVARFIDWLMVQV
jgi:LysR family glycine cleavage system transcriptional activator